MTKINRESGAKFYRHFVDVIHTEENELREGKKREREKEGKERKKK